MGALAHNDRGAPDRLAEAVSNRPKGPSAHRQRPNGRRRANWNVLAQEVVAFPPVGTMSVSGLERRAVHRPEPGKAARSAARVPAASRLASGASAPVPNELSPKRTTNHAAATPSAIRAGEGAALARPRRVAPRSRGLRRLLPGAATLAVLASVWFGAGSLASLNRPALREPTAAVKIPGGYLYIARPGDTLWSIASKLQPGGDPRSLVADFEQQLHGGELVAGDRLKLP